MLVHFNVVLNTAGVELDFLHLLHDFLVDWESVLSWNDALALPFNSVHLSPRVAFDLLRSVPAFWVGVENPV